MTWINDLLAVASILGAIGIIWSFYAHQIRPNLRKMTDFLDDWFGQPARPGVPERLGVMSRLDAIEHELHPNGSTSLRDAVDRIERIQTQPSDPASPASPPPGETPQEGA